MWVLAVVVVVVLWSFVWLVGCCLGFRFCLCLFCNFLFVCCGGGVLKKIFFFSSSGLT